MNDSLSLLPDEELWRHRNAYVAHEVIPQVFRLILSWGCPLSKPPEMDFATFCQNLTQNNLREYFIEPEINKLKAISDDESVDAPLLFKIIQSCCEKLKGKKDPVWYEPDYSKFEYLLWRAKELRNDICHNLASIATSSKTYEDTIEVCLNIINKAGLLYDIDKMKIVKETNKIKDIDNFMVTQDEVRRKACIQYNFWREGYKESLAYWKQHCCSDVILFSGERVLREKVYHPLHISIKTLTTNESPRMVPELVPYTKILEPWNDKGDFNVTIVKGEAGSGKSTVAKNLAQQFFKLTKSEICSLDKFHLIHFLECRKRTSKNLETFIKNSFSNSTKLLGVEDILSCFNSLCHLIFIDGFDECNENSLNVIRELLNKVKMIANCQIVITTRPHSIGELQNLIERAGMVYRTCEIMPITKEPQQIDFLKRYQETSYLEDNTEEMIKVFKSLPLDVKSFFVYPINLLLFYHLFQNDSDRKNIFKNVSDIPRKILYHYKMFIKKKLGQDGMKNIDSMINEVMEEFNLFAFTSLKEDKMELSSNDLSSVVGKCNRIIEEYGQAEEININHIISVIFLNEYSPIPGAEPSYHFFHKSIQEIFASRGLLTIMDGSPDGNTMEIFREKFNLIGDFKELIPIFKK